MEEVFSAEAAERGAEDVLAVVGAWDRHPIGSEAEELICEKLASLAALPAFRTSVSALPEQLLSDATRNLLRRASANAFRCVRNLCGASRVVQLQTALWSGHEEACSSAVALQMLSNACVQNPEAADAIVARVRFASPLAAETAAPAAALLHNARVWAADREGAQRLLDRWAPAVVEAYRFLHSVSQDVWVVAVITHARVPLPQAHGRLLLRAWAARQEARIDWVPVARRWALEEPEAASRLACDDSDRGREQSRRLLLAEGFLAQMHAALGDDQNEKEAAHVGHLLALLGNLLFHQPPHCGEAVLAERGLIERVLSWSRFDPEHGLTREWALLVVRNVTETCPAMHAHLAGMQVLGVADTPELREIEARTGRRMQLGPDGKPQLK